MISKSFTALLLLAVAALSAGAEVDGRNLQLDLGCEANEEIIFDDDCLADAEEARDDAFEAADELFADAVEEAQDDARKAIERADRKLRRKVTASRIDRRCGDADNFNSCAVSYIERQRTRFEERQQVALDELEEEEEAAAGDRKAARKAARRVFNAAVPACGECVQFSFRF